MDPEEPDILFGLCDLGFQCPELGSVSLQELEGIQLKHGLSIERDINFNADVAEARARAYAAIDVIDWPTGFYRRDIGWRALSRDTVK
jgi:hypothetical protein